MRHKVQFVDVEEDEKDLIVAFAIGDLNLGVKTVMLLRTPVFEYIFGEEERGVKVSMEGDHYDKEDFNMLTGIKIAPDEIAIESIFRTYVLDTSSLEEADVEDILRVVKKQNFDNRFKILFSQTTHPSANKQ